MNEASLFDLWRQNHYLFKEKYQSQQTSYIPYLLPEIAVQLNIFEILEILQRRFGFENLQKALNPEETIESPVSHFQDGCWLKKSKMVGINVRTIDNFWNVVKYALTIPKSQDSIHLLPIWEPGVVSSLYGVTSFNINQEFFSHELANTIPHLNTVEKQLKVVINLLHLMGKSVGMDVIPHTDRFSEMVIAFPRYFEWIRRVGGKIISNSETLYQEIEEIIWQFLNKNGSANQTPISYSKNIFFDPEIPILTEEQKHEILFGYKTDYEGRLNRRVKLMYELIYQGFETLPMTMAPPYRGLHIDPENYILDEHGNRWYNYQFDKPEGMSRVFGPLARYKFYFSKNDNANWELDFERPNKSAWNYICQRYYDCQQQFNLDFMRGDMAHVQPRPNGVPKEIDEFYDPLRAVKKFVQNKGIKHFGFFAETFLAHPNFMGYGDELDHLEAIEADSTLGDLQATIVGSGEYMEKFVDYYKWLKTRKFAPNYTIITGDKDDPRFDEFYRTANHLRMFVGLFFDMPSYMSLGFETRSLNLERNLNETYSKLYVFEITDDNQPDKVTHGKYVWGRNQEQFMLFQQLREIAENNWEEIKNQEVRFLLEVTENQKLMVWTYQESKKFIFVANLDSENAVVEKLIEKATNNFNKELIFSTLHLTNQHECRIYRLE